MTHPRPWSRPIWWAAAGVAVVLAAGAGTAITASAQSDDSSSTARTTSAAGVAEQMDKARAALAKYESVQEAEAAGYHPASPCESTPTSADASWWGGAMGVHYVNPDLMKPGPIDPAKPPILMYLPTSNGAQLLGAEYFQPDADQDVHTDGDRPSLFGRAFDGPMLGHAPGMPVHYDLHVWLFKHNPSGIFAPWNPDVTCS